MKKINKLIIIFFASLLFFSVLVQAVSSHSNSGDGVRRVCLERGQSIPNAENPVYTCESALCVQCIDSRNRIVDIEQCRDIPECSPLQDFRFVDIVPPEIDLFLPLHQKVYNERRIELHVETDEFAEIEIMDNTESSTRRTTLCKECIIHRNLRSFRDGFHILTVVATDASGNFDQRTIDFFVDTREPNILKTAPKKGFADGEFSVEFREDNPAVITLFYGNTLSGYMSKILEPNSCTFVHRKYSCSIVVDISDFEASGIEYWFSVEDIAGHQDVSRIQRLEVDTLAPIIHDIDISESHRVVNIVIDVEERNFDFVEYIDHSDSRARWKRLCNRLNYSSLNRGTCFANINLVSGIHELEIRAVDEAGNFASEIVIVEI